MYFTEVVRGTCSFSVALHPDPGLFCDSIQFREEHFERVLQFLLPNFYLFSVDIFGHNF